jgi:hypothetical protein
MNIKRLSDIELNEIAKTITITFIAVHQNLGINVKPTQIESIKNAIFKDLKNDSINKSVDEYDKLIINTNK